MITRISVMKALKSLHISIDECYVGSYPVTILFYINQRSLIFGSHGVNDDDRRDH